MPLDTATKYNHPDIANVLRAHGGKSGKEVGDGSAAQTRQPLKKPDHSVTRLLCSGETAVTHTAASTSAAWPFGFTSRKIFLSRPSGAMTNVVRKVPMYSRPMNFFFSQTP